MARRSVSPNECLVSQREDSEHPSEESEQRAKRSVSSTPLRSQTGLPIEILTQILSHVSFPDLYRSCQYVNHAWQFVVTHLILGNTVFMRRLIQTDYKHLLRTDEGEPHQEEFKGARYASDDDTWPGVAIDRDSLVEHPGLMDVRWRGRNGHKFFFRAREAYATANSPYLVRGDLLTFRERQRCSIRSYNVLTKISTDQRRPVLLYVLDFSDDKAELHLDLRECYRALFWDHQNSVAQMYYLAEYLEADLWSGWCHKNSKFWGKKQENKYKQGVFIEHVDIINSRMQENYDDLQSVLQLYDWHDRKVRTYASLSLESLMRHRVLDIADLFENLEPSYGDPAAVTTTTEIEDAGLSLYTRHRARFDKTALLMMRHFKWHLEEQIAQGILTPDEYDNMFDIWRTQILAKWKQTRTLTFMTPVIEASIDEQ